MADVVVYLQYLAAAADAATKSVQRYTSAVTSSGGAPGTGGANTSTVALAGASTQAFADSLINEFNKMTGR